MPCVAFAACNQTTNLLETYVGGTTLGEAPGDSVPLLNPHSVVALDGSIYFSDT